MLDDGFGEAARGVMGAGAAAVGAGGDVEGSLGEDEGSAERVLAEEGGEGFDLGDEVVVVAAGESELAEVHLGAVGEGLGEGGLGSAGGFLEEVEEGVGGGGWGWGRDCGGGRGRPRTRRVGRGRRGSCGGEGEGGGGRPRR